MLVSVCSGVCNSISSGRDRQANTDELHVCYDFVCSVYISECVYTYNYEKNYR